MPALAHVDVAEHEVAAREQRRERVPERVREAPQLRQPGESKPLPWPSALRSSWYSQGESRSSTCSASVTRITQWFARPSRRTASTRSSAAMRAIASSVSNTASLSQSSDDWCTVWKSASSRCIISSGVFCSASSSSVRR